MDKEKLQSTLIDYIDNKLNSVDRLNVEQLLMKDQEAFRLYEELKEVIHAMHRSAQLDAPGDLKKNFDAMLAEEMAADRRGKTFWLHPTFYRAAAAVLLVILGAGIGYLISERQSQRLADVERKLQEQEEQMRVTNQMMAMLANNESASKRMQGVNVALTIDKAGDKIVDALVKVMNEDPNSNVRLSALEALSKFIDEQEVRDKLIRSLPAQKDPIVQIALIQLLVKMKEKSVVDDLQKIVDDEGTIQAVRDEAYSGILKLS